MISNLLIMHKYSKVVLLILSSLHFLLRLFNSDPKLRIRNTPSKAQTSSSTRFGIGEDLTLSLSLLLTNVSSVYDTVFYLSYTTAIFQWRSWATSQTPTGIGVESAVFGYSSSKSSFSTDTDEDCFPRLFEKVKVVYVLCVSPACEQNLIVNFSHSPCHLKGPLANSPQYYKWPKVYWTSFLLAVGPSS